MAVERQGESTRGFVTGHLYTSQYKRGGERRERVTSRSTNLDRDGARATCDAMHLPHRQARPRTPPPSPLQSLSHFLHPNDLYTPL